MQKTVKKLRLNRDSLLLLDQAEIARVVAGTDNTDLQNSCGSICYTDKACGRVIAVAV